MTILVSKKEIVLLACALLYAQMNVKDMFDVELLTVISLKR